MMVDVRPVAFNPETLFLIVPPMLHSLIGAGHDLKVLAADVERRRHSQHAEYCSTLSNAWKSR
jgi:hypothetical protein